MIIAYSLAPPIAWKFCGGRDFCFVHQVAQKWKWCLAHNSQTINICWVNKLPYFLYIMYSEQVEATLQNKPQQIPQDQSTETSPHWITVIMNLFYLLLLGNIWRAGKWGRKDFCNSSRVVASRKLIYIYRLKHIISL